MKKVKQLLVNIVKYFKFLHKIYYYSANFFLKAIKLFIKTDDKLILINSFGGKKYDDSPKAIYEEMKKDKRFNDYKIVWAFHNPENYIINGAEVIKTDTLKYFITALKARCWITNSAIERGLRFKGKNTFYFNTWHGTPLKKMGTDISSQNKSFGVKGNSLVDIMTAQSDFEADIFSRVFRIPRENFLMCGLPRNDNLKNYTSSEREEIRERLNIPKDKKVILYAPTFREFERDSKLNCTLIPPMDINLWETQLKEDFCLLFRAHYEVSNLMEIKDNEFVRNMTSYPSLDELMIASDILITDYSSIMFDWCVMDKPVFLFCYDYEQYEAKRGMYFDIRESFSNGNNENEIINILKNYILDEELNKVNLFKNKYLNYYGNATKSSLECILKNIGGIK